MQQKGQKKINQIQNNELFWNIWSGNTFLHYILPILTKWGKYMFAKWSSWNARHENYSQDVILPNKNLLSKFAQVVNLLFT